MQGYMLLQPDRRLREYDFGEGTQFSSNGSCSVCFMYSSALWAVEVHAQLHAEVQG